mgnify:CR=1 FL=1
MEYFKIHTIIYSSVQIIPASIDCDDKVSIQENLTEVRTSTDDSLGSTPLIRKKQLKNVFYTPNPCKKVRFRLSYVTLINDDACYEYYCL